MNETRSAGWYPDPWGTDEERYFDGSAWARETRVVGSETAAPTSSPTKVVDPSGPAGAGLAAGDDTRGDVPGDLPGPADDDAPVPAPVPAGWHRDPWGIAGLRWWDGSQWTGHISGPAQTGVVDVAGERSLARWVQPALLAGGVAQAITIVTSVPQVQWVVDHWTELTRRDGSTPQIPQSDAAGLAQLGFFVGLLVGVLFLLWFHRAASTGWAAGLPARRRPGLATLSFVIPILNLWWPYQATLDMVPATGDRGRVVILRWWVLWWTGILCGPLVYVAAAISSESAAWVVAWIGAVAMVAAAFAARSVVEYVTSAHEQLAASTSTAT